MNFEHILSLFSTLGTLFFSTAAAIIALIALYFSFSSYKQTLFIELFKEYKSSDMLIAVKYLYDKYEIDCSEKEENLVNLYIAEYKNDTELEFHKHRRMVSYFYQQMAMLFVKNQLPEELVISSFPQGGIDIIYKILLPLELNALRYCFRGKPAEQIQKIPLSLKFLQEFYNALGDKKIIIDNYGEKDGYDIYLELKKSGDKDLRKIGISSDKIFLNTYLILKNSEKAKYKIILKNNK